MGKPFHHKMLRVDLSTGEIRTEHLPDNVYRKYLGGGALASYFLLREQTPGADPYGPDNHLIFMTSVMNGTTFSGANRYTAAARSPLTGGYGESEAGGYWGPELKAAGFDGIVVRGVSPRPVYLWINDGEVELRDASHLWGREALEVQETLEQELGDKRVRVLQTGIAGENRVRFAAIVNQLKHFHGRCGLGAVMGAKQLKAIACRGHAKIDPVDRDAWKQVIQWFRENYDRDHDAMHLYGTSRAVPALQADGILPTRNFRRGQFELYNNISGQTMARTILTNTGTCFACAVACKREVEVPELGVTPRYGGPEYETIGATGSLLGIGDLKQVALANQLTGVYVLDSISTGVAIAFAFECYEHGILTKEDTGGLELTWGNAEAAQKLIHLIARREGIGDLLAEGVARAAQKLGRGSERFALHVKGQELPMHEPRGKRSLAIAYATSPTGADHMEAPHDPMYEAFGVSELNPLSVLGLIEPVNRLDLGPRKVRAYYYCQRVWSLYNQIGMCDFVGVPLNPLRVEKLNEYVNAVTGWHTSLWELLKVGERADTMARLFNLREGLTAADDRLPDRMFEPLENGPLEGQALDRDEVQRAITLYYQMMGWDEQGRPTPAKLAELDLEWAR
ncbi:MAG: aldehyde ferredoxin oxidoreductase family protein [Chloroflexi bacterium]|nr:aldehyde ferredoxin oxidoreductase family protein [Chloroflexota bacterium]